MLLRGEHLTTNDALLLTIPLLTAIVTLGLTWWKEARQSRSREHVRQRLLAQVKEEISMIEAWAKAHASLASSDEPPPLVRSRAQRDLDAAYDRMGQLAPELRQPITLQMTFSRLLLRHVPVRGGARFFRVVYYLSLVWLFALGLVAFPQPSSWSEPASILATFIAYFTFAAGPAWFLGWLTMSLAHRQERRREQQMVGDRAPRPPGAPSPPLPPASWPAPETGPRPWPTSPQP
jgi:hypothetical protein